MFEIVILKNGVEASRQQLKTGSLNIGRSDDNHIVLREDSVSRRHARLVVEKDRVVVEDLGSGNGTFMRGGKIRREELFHNDEVVITPFIIRLNAPQLVAEGQETDPGAELRTVMIASPGRPTPQNPAPPPKPSWGPGQPTGARMTLVRGQATKTSYPLVAGPFTIGRSDDRDAVLTDPASSRRHAMLEFREDHYFVKDEGSANGVQINGNVCREGELKHGDHLIVGQTEFEFTWPDGPARSQPATAPANTVAGNYSAEGGVDPYAETGFMPAYSPWAAQQMGLAPQPGQAAAPQQEATEAAPAQQAAAAYNAAQMAYYQQQQQQAGAANPYAGVEMVQAEPKKSPLKFVLVAVLLLIVVGFGFKIKSDAQKSADAAATAAVQDPCAKYDLVRGCEDATDEVCRKCLILKTRLDTGKELFKRKEFSSALVEFQQVLQNIDPENDDARRMAYLTYEFWVLTNAETVLSDRSQSSAQKLTTITTELDKAKKIYERWGKTAFTRQSPQATINAGKAELNTAALSLNNMLKINVDDPAAKALQQEGEQLKSKVNYKLGEIRRVMEVGTAEAFNKEVQSLYEEGMAAKNRGDNKTAIARFEDTISRDPNGETSYSGQARSEIANLKASVRNRAQPLYDQALTKINQELHLEARAKLQEAVKIDPTFAEAKAKLAEVNAVCEKQGQKIYNEAKVQFNVSQFAQAEKMLKQVLEYIPDPNNETHQRAKKLLQQIQKG